MENVTSDSYKIYNMVFRPTNGWISNVNGYGLMDRGSTAVRNMAYACLLYLDRFSYQIGKGIKANGA